MSGCDDKQWRLTAPWWRWPLVGTPNRDVRSLPPAIQMYDASDPVTMFMKEPQKALAYSDAVDRVQQLVSGGGSPGGKLSSFSSATLVPTPTRKLFLPLHKRFYLVVCELHCDSAGFPSVSRDKVCEAGMVIRRRRLNVASAHAPQALTLLNEIGEITTRIAKLERGVEKRVLKRRHRVTAGAPTGALGATALLAKSTVHQALDEAAMTERANLETQLATKRAQLLAWKNDSGTTSLSEGWIPSEFENVGSWQVVENCPDATAEVVYPLHPLVPDPRAPTHDGTGKTIYFGMIPVGSREVDMTGGPRFETESRYEVRCFVRRHRVPCPKTGEPNDCDGELVWSAPTEAFSLAPHFDPIGSGNHPIVIQMPDIPALAAAAATGTAKLPVQMHFPAKSNLIFQVEDGEATSPATNGIPQICFFSIPLITIVATFVLNLFLPIVVFVFQLWFLLGLKFCIPPSLSIRLGIDFDLSAQINLDAQLDAAISVSAGAALGLALAADLNLALVGNAFATVAGGPDPEDLTITPLPGFDETPGGEMRDTFETPFLKSINDALVAEEVDTGSVVAGLVFVPRVERAQVAA